MDIWAFFWKCYWNPQKPRSKCMYIHICVLTLHLTYFIFDLLKYFWVVICTQYIDGLSPDKIRSNATWSMYMNVNTIHDINMPSLFTNVVGSGGPIFQLWHCSKPLYNVCQKFKWNNMDANKEMRNEMFNIF